MVIDNTITVTVLVANINEAPVFPSASTDTRNVAENTPAGVNIGAPIAATDDDNDPLTYSLDATSRDNFDIVPTTGQLRTKAALNHEDLTSYRVTVMAADPFSGNDTTRLDVTITVNNVEEAGTVTLSSTQPIVGTRLDRYAERARQRGWRRDLAVGEFSKRAPPPGPPSVGQPQTPIRRLPPM